MLNDKQIQNWRRLLGRPNMSAEAIERLLARMNGQIDRLPIDDQVGQLGLLFKLLTAAGAPLGRLLHLQAQLRRADSHLPELPEL